MTPNEKRAIKIDLLNKLIPLFDKKAKQLQKDNKPNRAELFEDISEILSEVKEGYETASRFGGHY